MCYLDKHRKELYEDYPSFDDYKKKFTVSEDMMNALIAAAEKDKIKKDEKGLSVSGDIIKLQIKALLARDLWKNDCYYEIINNINDGYQKALDVFKNDSFKKYKINAY